MFATNNDWCQDFKDERTNITVFSYRDWDPFLVNTQIYQNIENFLSDVHAKISETLQWRHNERHGVSTHRHLDC